MRPVHITDTTLRDAHQSLWATRMEIGDMLPILPKMDSVGYWSLEVWGGATFDAALRFLNENPWERLRTIKQHCPNTPLQMLLRGQNLVGYHHYSDEIVNRFVCASKRNGIEVFRVFDALNDIRNVVASAEAIKECGGLFEGAISYTVSPVHTLDSYLEYAQELKDLGADTICIKDMAGMLTPFRTEKMVRALKTEIGLPVHVHCHYIGGMAPMNYVKAAEAGADIVDTAVVSLAFGNSQPAVETIVAALMESPVRHRSRPRPAVRDRRVLGGCPRAQAAQARHHHAALHGGLQPPGTRRHDEQPRLAARGAEGERPARRRPARDRHRARRGRLPAARHAAFADRRHAGRHQRAHRQALERRAQRDEATTSGATTARRRAPWTRTSSPRCSQAPSSSAADMRPGSLVTTTYAEVEAEIGDLAKSEEDVLMYALFPNEARQYLSTHQEGAEKAVFLMGEELETVKEDEAVDVGQIRELIKVIEASDVSEVVIEEGESKITVRRGFVAAAQAPATAPVASASTPAAAAG